MGEVETFRVELEYGGYACLVCDGSDLEELEEYFWLVRELTEFREHMSKVYDGLGLVVLKDIWVEEEERGMGYGCELLVDFLSFVRGRGIGHVYLVADEVVSNEIDWVDLYEGYGFEQIGGTVGYMVLMYRGM